MVIIPEMLNNIDRIYLKFYFRFCQQILLGNPDSAFRIFKFTDKDFEDFGNFLRKDVSIQNRNGSIIMNFAM